MRIGAIVFAIFLTGCAQPPRPCEPTRTLYVVSHGWHSGIVVERAELVQRRPGLGPDLGQALYVEVGWGEERFYQARETNVLMALRAILWPNASVLQVVPFHAPPHRYFAQSRIVEMPTDEAGYAAVLGYIADSFERSPGPQRLGRSLYGEGWFYRAEGSFHLFNTCNSWVATALERASCRSTRER